jgi:hypothetical protein
MARIIEIHFERVFYYGSSQKLQIFLLMFVFFGLKKTDENRFLFCVGNKHLGMTCNNF